MRAATEHPRIAISIAAALIVLALAGVGAGRALDAAHPVHASDSAVRIADREVGGLRRRLQAGQARSGQLRRQVTTLTTELARARQSEQRARISTHIKRRRAKH